MTPEIQRSILGACARFIRKQLDPVTKQLDELRGALSGAVTKSDLEAATGALNDKLANPAAWLSKELIPPGEPGKDAEPISLPDVAAEILATDALSVLVDLHVAEAVAKYFEANPVKHGKDAEPVTDGQLAKHVETYLSANPPDPGKDGKNVTADDVKGVVELEVMKGLRDLERHAGEVIQRAADAIPKPKDGVDGLGFDDCDVTYDGERSFTVKWQNGDRVKEKTFHVPTIIDRGYWREGAKAEAGDAMTHDGTLWIALRDTSAKPARESEDWRIGARKGRDGLQGPPGKAYVPPGPVKLGVGNE